MKIAIILGTRPEIIKLSPIIKELKEQGTHFFIIHTNQHYYVNTDRIFFYQLNLPFPKYNLHIRENNHGKMTGRMLSRIEDILLSEKPDYVIVQGDTNSVLAGALAASKLSIKICHVEAGLRSFDRAMPEEINRVITDHLSDLLFAPTLTQKKILIKEGIDREKIFVTGNTIVDAVKLNLHLAKRQRNLQHYKKEKFFLLTLHRPSNVDNPTVLKNLLTTLEKIAKTCNISFYFPIHPRTKKQIKLNNIKFNKNKILLMKPVGYLEMLMLENYAKILFTDSGGLQEEACILKVPCIILRANTERPEVLRVGASVLANIAEDCLLKQTQQAMKSTRKWKNPFGRGDAGKKIINLINAYAA